VVDVTRAGQSAALVLRGEPGIGKSALLEYSVDTAPEFSVVRAAGVESEMELAFAGVHQLCAPLLDGVARLPDPQQDALETAFGLSAGAAPDRFFVGLALLSLLSETAGERPVLCVVDDVHWLDRASAQVLAFVARRLHAESVGLLFATRTISERDELSGLPELALEGLAESDARELLRSVIPGPLDVTVADRIVAEAQGNPLALLELSRPSTPDQLAGGFGVPETQPLLGRMEAEFRQRIERLPEETQLLLLLAAADPLGDPALLWRAAAELGLTSDAAAPAESDGLVTIGGTVAFRHPLVRSAVYRPAPIGDRRKVHGALAAATDPTLDPDRRAWHHAQAAPAADEEVAAELERSADRAQARGGLAAAGAFLEQAARLTRDPARRWERALAAAETKYEAGAIDAALALLVSLEAGPLADWQHARVDLLHARITYASRRGSDAAPLLLKAAQALDAIDVDLARATYLEALSAAMFAGRLAVGAGVVEVSEAARAAPGPRRRPGSTDLLLDGLTTRFTDGYTVAAPILREALTAFRGGAQLAPHEARWIWLACWAAADLRDDEAWTVLSTTHLRLAREAGALAVIPVVLTVRSFVHAFSGELDAAAALLDEMEILADATGSRAPPYVAQWIAVLQGREGDAMELFEGTVADAMARGEGQALSSAEWGMAILHNSLGRYEAALPLARRAAERTEKEMTGVMALPELVEAAARCGNAELAARPLELLAETARASDTDWAIGLGARSRALLSQGETAETLYREAITRLGRTRIRVDLARAHLLFGEWLRRERRRTDAREHLRTAHELFTTMGMQAFAERAARELLASGERARARTVETQWELTAQEGQIARLARDGLSNPDIGSRLFISPRTVEYHLSKVFTKLDISSRNELSTVLEREPSASQLG
jgi:DNA-binding CsgD family transcriptional regulator